MGPDEEGSTTPREGLAGRARRFGAVAGLVVLAASAIYGGNFFGIRQQVLDLPTPQRPATGRVAGPATSPPDTGADTGPDTAPTETLLRSQPWWQQVDTFQGRGAATPRFTIDDSAVQWRVAYDCESGRLVVETPDREEPVVEAECPADDVGYASGTGQFQLEVTAGGAWQLEVAQQVEVPLREPPLEAMSAPGAEQIATGSFYDIDQTGRGTVTIYRLADGRHALRLDEFFVTPNVDLEVRLSPLAEPKTTEQFRDAPSVIAAGLDATAGSMNFIIPDDIDPTAYESVVIWCPPVVSAYAAAGLGPPG